PFADIVGDYSCHDRDVKRS
ncbi:hypothetical protein EVA_22219, partial [gut metagenome]